MHLVTSSTAWLDGVSKVSLTVESAMFVVIAVGKVHKQFITLSTDEAGRMPDDLLTDLVRRDTQIVSIDVTLTLVTRL